MKPLDPRLETLLSLSRPPSSAPTQQLENRIIATWRQNRCPEQDLPTIYPAALACACGLFALALVSSFSLLAAPANPTVLLANAALHEAFHP